MFEQYRFATTWKQTIGKWRNAQPQSQKTQPRLVPFCPLMNGYDCVEKLCSLFIQRSGMDQCAFHLMDLKAAEDLPNE